jgi:hypothetical protein
VEASVLKKKYPQAWKLVYETMVDDICEAFAPENVQTKIVERLAHNAAYLAVSEVHKSRPPKGK